MNLNSPLTLRQLCNRLLYALLALVVVVVLMRVLGTQSLVGTPFGFALGAIGIFAGTSCLLSVYRLSRRMSQGSGTAWLILCLQIIPILGLPAAIALLLKANAAAAAQDRVQASPGASPSGSSDA